MANSVTALVPLNVISLTAAPSITVSKIGDVYFNSLTQQLQVFTSTGWVAIGAGTGGGDPNPQIFMLMGA